MNAADKIVTKTRRASLTGRRALWRLESRGNVLPANVAGFPADWQKRLRPNQIQLGWLSAVAMLMGPGDRGYRIGGMYVEFENVADPGPAIVSPDYSVDEGIEYYEDLALSGSRDFLRLPLTSQPIQSVAAGYEDRLPQDIGNQLTFFSVTAGTTGVHGKEFSSSAISKIFGLALVATPIWGDRTQDIVIARSYLADDEQDVKQASKQHGVTWELTIGEGD